MTSSTDPVARTRATYDRIAGSYAAAVRTPYAGLLDDVAGFVTSLDRAAPLVLDAGAGPGQHSALLAERGARVVTLDLSAGMLRAGRAAWRVQGDLRALPLRHGVFDGVWCHAALLHVPRADVPAVLREFARVTRPGARLSLGVAEGDGEGWEPDSPHGAGTPRYYVRHEEPDLRALLRTAGWSVDSTSRRRTHRRWLYVGATRPGT